MFLTGGLPSDVSSTKIEKDSYSQRHPVPDWRGHTDAKIIKKKAPATHMFTPLPDVDMNSSKVKALAVDTFATPEPLEFEKASKKTTIFKSISKFFTKLFRNAHKI